MTSEEVETINAFFAAASFGFSSSFFSFPAISGAASAFFS
eukprot:CAMPEP_0171278320 /NCGR_PEP_ID=MMETSP0790-20130122/64812_1 /TAXON_ID=2925 /ORGANISM="Alexandrium catenella, Strain OF101" /LENGTH=39 /DNA_ID= /DNA_START= /DNA_END= /DNA_ORIENTATION=